MKISEFQALLTDLAACARKLAETAEALQEASSETKKELAKKKEKEKAQSVTDDRDRADEEETEPEKVWSREEVRAVLAEKSALENGKYRAEVKALVKKYGNGGTLTAVDPRDYAALAAEAEVIGNAR